MTALKQLSQGGKCKVRFFPMMFSGMSMLFGEEVTTNIQVMGETVRVVLILSKLLENYM